MNHGDAGSAIHPLAALRDLLGGHPLFAIGILLFVGFLLAKLAARLRLPEITGFIVAGILMGETVSGIIPRTMSGELSLVTEIALGLIALTVGAEFYGAKLKRHGRGIVVIAIVQSVFTLVIVTASLTLAGLGIVYAVLLASIAGATAPAATVAIVQAARARGPFVDHLYGLVALDDAVSLGVFAVAFTVVVAWFTASAGASGGGSSLAVAVTVAYQLAASVATGLAGGWVIHRFARGRSNSHESLITTVGVVFLTTAIAFVFDLNVLVTNLVAGALLINLSAQNHRVFRYLEPFTPPIFALFFVLAGTEFQPGLLTPHLIVIAAVYVVARAVAKVTGVYVGCRAVGLASPIRRNLGLCMLPHAGVAIGMALLFVAAPATQSLAAAERELFLALTNVVLVSVFVYELIGPFVARRGLLRGVGGEV
ncbi:MAG: hypothetical protein EA382_07570 [Spirochaetaceae bacterium]|nr:MAG: hypothetical protein EA382_07570 [Spirochaetaceae bacterium]